MSIHEKQFRDCPDCKSPDVEMEPAGSGVVVGECHNCERTFHDYDREYQVTDSDDDSGASRDARKSNRKRGFFW